MSVYRRTQSPRVGLSDVRFTPTDQKQVASSLLGYVPGEPRASGARHSYVRPISHGVRQELEQKVFQSLRIGEERQQ